MAKNLTEGYTIIATLCPPMRLADFILANIESIMMDWERFARSLNPGMRMEKLALRNDAESILRACVRDMRSSQTLAEQSSKSKGHGGAGGSESERLDSASAVHGVGRVGSGFNLDEVVSEYRALRASVLGLWRASNPAPDQDDLGDVTRFNEAIDQSLAKAVAAYTHRVDQSRRMFLAILSHDLRNPLNSITMSAKLGATGKPLDPESSDAFSQIERSANAIAHLIDDLMDFASAGLGSAMPLSPVPLNLQRLCREVVNELKAAHPGRVIRLDAQAELTCTCDGPRVRQVLSNLLGNALVHGSPDGPIDLWLRADGSDIVLAVRNEGNPIPPELLPTLFNPLVRTPTEPAQVARRRGSIGLGLYIVHEIVIAHGGTIDVQSSARSGTVFTVRLPQTPHHRIPAPAGQQLTG